MLAVDLGRIHVTAGLHHRSRLAEALEELAFTVLHFGADGTIAGGYLLLKVEDVALVLLYKCFSNLKHFLRSLKRYHSHQWP